jgi:hypothetical protein
VCETGASGDTRDNVVSALNWDEDRSSWVPAQTSHTDQGGALLADEIASAFISVALARLERDHAALLAAMCELTSPSTASLAPAGVADSPVLRQALITLLREDLRQTQHALTLAADGTYGYCEICHRVLPSRTLLMYPATTWCENCAAADERARQIH